MHKVLEKNGEAEDFFDQKFLQSFANVVNSSSEDFAELAKTANLSPQNDFLERVFNDINFGVSDLRLFNFSKSEFLDCVLSFSKLDRKSFANCTLIGCSLKVSQFIDLSKSAKKIDKVVIEDKEQLGEYYEYLLEYLNRLNFEKVQRMDDSEIKIVKDNLEKMKVLNALFGEKDRDLSKEMHDQFLKRILSRQLTSQNFNRINDSIFFRLSKGSRLSRRNK